MCVLALAWRAHPRWRFVVAGNRDELHARPAAPLARWPEADHLLAGRDLLSGGTWMGVSEQGRFAVVTNLRGFEGPRPEAPSRGWLLRDNLSGEGAYADPDDAALDRFSPFNLIRIHADAAEFQTNRPRPSRHALTPGVHGLSNGGLNESWPKTERLKDILSGWLAAGADRPETLLGGLQEDRLPDRTELPIPPSDAPLEPAVSPIFIRNPLYGTRCGTVAPWMNRVRASSSNAVLMQTAPSPARQPCLSPGPAEHRPISRQATGIRRQPPNIWRVSRKGGAMTFTQLDPALPVRVLDKGEGYAIAVIDYGQEHNLIWVTAINDTGEIWCAPNPKVRLTANWTMGRKKPPSGASDACVSSSAPASAPAHPG